MKIYTFFVLVIAFCGSLFADCETDKENCLAYLSSSTQQVYYIVNTANDVAYIANTQLEYGSSSQVILQSDARNILQKASALNGYLGSLRGIVESVDCGSTNGTCAVDLWPLAEICSNIYAVVASEYSALTNCEDHLWWIHTFVTDLASAFSPNNANSLVNSDFNVKVFDSQLLAAVSNNIEVMSYNFGVVSNQLANIDNFIFEQLQYPDDPDVKFIDLIAEIDEFLYSCLQDLSWISSRVRSIMLSVEQYLPYLQTISNDLKSIGGITNSLAASSLLSFDRFRYYAQGQLNSSVLQLYPLSPYDTASNLRNATIYDAVAAGFESLLISQGSINNYLYWLKAVSGSNRLDVVNDHIIAVSNLVGRLDDYVLGDFSNEVARIAESLSFLTNRVDYTTNLVDIVDALHTNNQYLASIDSKLDVLDYIKVLSDTPLSDFSGDSYYDYLTNLYLNGASSSSPSTNWFERIEILLASLVFGDSGGSTISNEVSFSDFSENTVESALTTYSFGNELNSGVSLVENTGNNFYQILAGFDNRLSGAVVPQRISIGIGVVDGQDTSSFDDLVGGHFQVSFSSGSVDSFTLVVRSVTTIIWILITMLMVFYSGRWLLSKVLFFYRIMQTLITSLYLK